MSNDPEPSPAEILAQIEQRYPDVAKIISRIEKLDRAANTQLWIAMLYRPTLHPGILLVPKNLYLSICDMACKETNPETRSRLHEQVDENNHLRAMLDRRALCCEIKKDRIAKRNKLIDQLLEKKFNKEDQGEEIHKHIMEQHPELLKIKRSNRYTNHKNMWKKYLKYKRTPE